jgi:hypothetical protein
VGHKIEFTNTQEVCVCARDCFKRRAAAERVGLWAGLIGKTAACIFDKHQSKRLCKKCMRPESSCKSAAEHAQHKTPDFFGLLRAFFAALLPRAAPENRT